MGKSKQSNGFWADMMSGNNGGVSSKRVIGTIVILILLAVIVVNTFIGADNHWLGEAFITMEVGAFAMLGIGIFEKRLGKKTGDDKKDDEGDDLKEFNEDC